MTKLVKFYYLLLALTLIISISIKAQLPSLLSTQPVIIKENNTTSIVVTADANKGNQGLLGYTNLSDVYVHTGVITSLSTGPSDWRYVKFNQQWGQTNPQLQATSLGNDKWSFTIPGDLRTYYGITNSSEKILKIAILFRSGDGSKKLANADGSDMYISVQDNTNLNIVITQPPMEPKYTPVPEAIDAAVGQNIFLEAHASLNSTMNLFLNGQQVNTGSNLTSLSANTPITQGCQNVFRVSANSGTKSDLDSVQFFVLPSSPIAALPAALHDGININMSDSSITWVLYAPGKSSVVLLSDRNAFQPTCNSAMYMTPDSMRFWYKISGITPNSNFRFQYLVDGNLRMADPYSELILDPWNDGDIKASTFPNKPSYPTGTDGIVGVVRMNNTAYNFQNSGYTKTPKENLIIYELLLRDFVSNHDFKTLKDSLTYIKNLGFNAIELMPVQEFDGNSSWGYNPSYYFAPDKYYGPKEDLQALVDAAHAMGIAIILDVTLNHTTGLNPLAMLYWDAANNRPAVDNPWLNPTAKHPFNVFNDFNHESIQTKQFVHRFIHHWLEEYDIDGFRWDLSKGFTQFYSGSDVGLWSQYDSSRVRIWKDYYDTMQAAKTGSVCILEHFADNPEEIELSNYGMLLWSNTNYSAAQNTMGYASDSQLDFLYAPFRGHQKLGLVSYAESHDEERIMYKNEQYGNNQGGYSCKDLNTALERTEAMQAFLFLTPGPKMAWQFGADLGYDYSINTCTDGTVNNNCRLDPKPIKWDFLNNPKRKRLYDVTADLLQFRKNYAQLFDTMTVHNSTNIGATLDKMLVLEHPDLSMVLLGNFNMINKTYSTDFPSNGTWYNYNDSTESYTYSGNPIDIVVNRGKYKILLNKKVPGGHVVTNIEELKSASVKIFPNPNSGTFNLQCSEVIESIEVQNILGQSVAFDFEKVSDKNWSVQLKSKANGIVLVHLYIRGISYRITNILLVD